MNWLSWQLWWGLVIGLAVGLVPTGSYLVARWRHRRGRWYLRVPQGVTVGPFRSKAHAQRYLADHEMHLDGYMPTRLPRR